MSDRERRYELTVQGHRVVMGALSARDVIRVIRGELDEVATLELVASRVVESDLPGDLLDEPFDLVLEVAQAWVDAAREAALPPATGRR